MIAMVEGAKRQKTPNEIALDILLAALTHHLPARRPSTLLPFSIFSVEAARPGTPVTITVLVALLVCLIPTTIGGLLSAIGIAGMDRMIQANVIATSGRAVEAAGDVDVLLLDKTGTITLGNRQASRVPAGAGRRREQRARRRRAARLAGRRDARRPQHRRAGQAEVRPARARRRTSSGATFVPFSAQTRMSGVDLDGPRRSARARPTRSRDSCRGAGRQLPAEVRRTVDDVARRGSTPLVVADGAARARRDRAQGHRQGRHQGALRRAAPHGHQDRDDHRRQPAHRRGDRRRGGRRRLPRRGHARSQAEADPRVSGAAAGWSR